MTRANDSGLAVVMQAAVERYPQEAAEAMERAPLAELAEAIADDEDTRWSEAFRRLSSERASRLLEVLPEAVAARLLAQIDAPIAASMLARVDEGVKEKLLDRADKRTRLELVQLMSHPSGTAGRIMDPRVFAFRSSSTAGDVLDRIRESAWKRVFEVFVVDDESRLLGSVPLQEVAVSPPESRLDALMLQPRAVVQATESREEVVKLLESTKVPVLPTLDFDGRLLGVIRYDELIAAARAEASVDLQTMVGVSREERALSKVSFAVRKRLPWLQVNLGTAFLAASVVGLFEDMIARFTALAVLLPVVAGQSGNTGAQALAVTMRGLALREIRAQQWARVLLKEARVGMVSGVAVAITTAFFVFLWSRSLGLAAVICISMVVSMSIAALAGGAIPLILTAIGQDPAQSSSIILTTITDVAGFFSFLGIATLLSGYL